MLLLQKAIFCVTTPSASTSRLKNCLSLFVNCLSAHWVINKGSKPEGLQQSIKKTIVIVKYNNKSTMKPEYKIVKSGVKYRDIISNNIKT